MKVLVVHPGFSWSSSDISRSAEAALRELGCETASFEPLDGLRLFSPLLAGASASGLRSAPDMALRAWCERLPLRVIEERPDLVLAVHGARLPEHVVRAVRSLGVPAAVWLVDDPHEIDLSSRYARAYDWVFTDERLALEAHRAAGSRNVAHLPLACNPSVHFPRPVADRYRSDVCIVGSGFRERLELLLPIQEELSKFSVRLVGPWNGLPEGSPLRPCAINAIVPNEEAALYCAGARIVINPHRDPGGSCMSSNLWGVKAASPNPRLFEAAACGAFVLCDEARADVGDYFDIGREIDVFSGSAGLLKKVRFWLSRDEERAAGAASASRRARGQHNMKARMASLLETAGLGLPAGEAACAA